jgi:hypothetical protein
MDVQENTCKNCQRRIDRLRRLNEAMTVQEAIGQVLGDADAIKCSRCTHNPLAVQTAGLLASVYPGTPLADHWFEARPPEAP